MGNGGGGLVVLVVLVVVSFGHESNERRKIKAIPPNRSA